ADVAHAFHGERAADDAADVVGAEDFCGNGHGWRNSRRRCGSQGRPGNGPVMNPAWPPVRGNSSTTLGEALRAAASNACSGRNGSLRALSNRVGTRMRSRYGPLDAALQ